MALYSWFVEAKNKLHKNSKFIGKESKKLTIKHKYLESYTMWPTANVIQGEKVTPPLKNKPASHKNEKVLLDSVKPSSLYTVLPVKSTKNAV